MTVAGHASAMHIVPLNDLIGFYDGRATGLRTVLAGYLAVLLVHGVMVAANDFWHEQLVKRGTTSFMLPDVITPGLTWGWGILLAAAAILYFTWFRVRATTARPLAAS